MSYDALTIDTNVFYENKQSLKGGLIGELDQYRDGLVDLVLSEIVTRELSSMLSTKAEAALTAVNKSLRLGIDNDQLTESQQTELKAIVGAMAHPKDHARTQIKAFLETTGAEIVPVDGALTRDLVGAYFGRKPPFSNAGKKDEFPDAIALLSLEEWARESGKKILAVSSDNDWRVFCEASEHIDIIADLGDAMASLQTAAEGFQPAANDVLQRLVSGTPPELGDGFRELLADAVAQETPYVEFASDMPGEEDGVELSLLSYALHEDDAPDIVRVRKDGFAIRIPATLNIKATAQLSFAIYDSVDKDYVPMGSMEAESEKEVYIELLVDIRLLDVALHPTSEGVAPPVGFEILDVQLIDPPHSFDIGYVDITDSPGWRDDEDDLYDADWRSEAAEDEKKD